MERELLDLRKSAEVAVSDLQRQVDSIKEGMEKMHSAAQQRDNYFDDVLTKNQASLGRHRSDINKQANKISSWAERINTIEDEALAMEVRVGEMSERLCRCGERSPVLSGPGSREDPLDIDRAESPLSYHTPPQENEVPIPVAFRFSTLPSSDQENTPPSCCPPLTFPASSSLVPIEEGEDESARAASEELDVRSVVRVNRRAPLSRLDQHPHRMVAGPSRRGSSIARIHRRELQKVICQRERRIERHLGWCDESSSSECSSPSPDRATGRSIPPSSFLVSGGSFGDYQEGRGDRHH